MAANPFRKIYNGIELMTPDKLRTLYDIPSAEEVANSYESDPTNTVGVFEDIDVSEVTGKGVQVADVPLTNSLRLKHAYLVIIAGSVALWRRDVFETFADPFTHHL